jgi:hypothetical protein
MNVTLYQALFYHDKEGINRTTKASWSVVMMISSPSGCINRRLQLKKNKEVHSNAHENAERELSRLDPILVAKTRLITKRRYQSLISNT